MKFRGVVLLVAFGLFGRLSVFAQDSDRADARSTVQSTYLPVHTFDAARDAAADIEEAMAEAAKTAIRLLLDVGGDWCAWCQLLDEFFRRNPSPLKLRDDNFITVAVYYGPDNKNDQVLSRYSPILGIP